VAEFAEVRGSKDNIQQRLIRPNLALYAIRLSGRIARKISGVWRARNDVLKIDGYGWSNQDTSGNVGSLFQLAGSANMDLYLHHVVELIHRGTKGVQQRCGKRIAAVPRHAAVRHCFE
jgi:hypothetical protein